MSNFTIVESEGEELNPVKLALAHMPFQLFITTQSAFYVNLYRAVIGPSG